MQLHASPPKHAPHAFGLAASTASKASLLLISVTPITATQWRWLAAESKSRDLRTRCLVLSLALIAGYLSRTTRRDQQGC